MIKPRAKLPSSVIMLFCSGFCGFWGPSGCGGPLLLLSVRVHLFFRCFIDPLHLLGKKPVSPVAPIAEQRTKRLLGISVAKRSVGLFLA